MGRKKKKSIIGYRYFMGMHLALCHGPVDAVTALAMQDRSFWTGTSTGGRIDVSAPELFGGERREGGISGALDVLMGDATQGPNDYLQAHMAGGGTVPSFRGILSLVLRRMYLAANNPYIKPIAARVKRIAAGWDPAAPAGWSAYEMTAGNGMNPACILYECLTDTRWGMGLPDSMIDGVSFDNARYKLWSERFGLNLVWSRQEPVETFVQALLDYMMAALRVTPAGRLSLKLLRAGDPVDAILSPHNVVALESFERPGWGETINEIVLTYSNHDTGQPETLTVQNLANLAAQGSLVSARRDYPGITDPGLAARVALRDLAVASSPLARVRLKVDGRRIERAYAMFGGFTFPETYIPAPGDLLQLIWPDLGIDRMLLRVGSAEVAGGADHTITLTCLEDVFRAQSAAIVTPSAAAWTAPSYAAAAPAASLAVEAAYWDVARTLSRAELAYVDPTDTWITALAVRVNDAQTQWRLYSGLTEATAELRSEAGYAPGGLLVSALPQSAADAILSLAGAMDMARFADCEYAWILDAGGQPVEAVGILATDAAASTLTVQRGVLDTVPVAHSAGARVIGWGPAPGHDDTVRAPGESVGVWIRTLTPSEAGALVAVAGGPMVALSGRQGLPYPPGNVLVNGLRYPAAILGAVSATWSHRDRIQQTAYLVRQDEVDIGPEAGVSYRVRYYGEAGTLLRTRTGIAGTADTWTEEAADSALPGGRLNGRIRVLIDAQRAGLTSWRAHDITCDRAGYGYRYGDYYGGI